MTASHLRHDLVDLGSLDALHTHSLEGKLSQGMRA